MSQINKLNSPGNLAQVSPLASLIDYQDGSIVSKTLIDKKGGTVTIFAFGDGQGLSEHSAPFDAMIYLLDGEAEMSISGKPHRLKEGEMIIIPVSSPHALRAVTRFKMMSVMIKS
jgi:quercetin dioxygenase-like cupin family protein